MVTKGLTWNRWAQNQIVNGNIHGLFGGHPEWVGVKLGDGSWLQAGNLMMEIADGLGRVRTPTHQNKNVEAQWGLQSSEERGAGLDQWFVMSHIADKELLRLAQGLGHGMVDGMKLTPETYARSYTPIMELMNLNLRLDIKGMLSDGTWAYSSELGKLFPHQHISRLHDIVGTVIELGTAAELNMPAQRDFAIGDAERNVAYLKGRYQIGIAARFIDRQGMDAVVAKYVQ